MAQVNWAPPPKQIDLWNGHKWSNVDDMDGSTDEEGEGEEDSKAAAEAAVLMDMMSNGGNPDENDEFDNPLKGGGACVLACLHACEQPEHPLPLPPLLLL